VHVDAIAVDAALSYAARIAARIAAGPDFDPGLALLPVIVR
jgi:hypothetical protein